MSTAVLDKLCSERDETRAAAVAIAESDDFNPDDKTYVELRSRASDLDARVASLAELIEQQSAADKLDGKLAKAAQQRQQRADEPQQQRVQTRESWGAAFTRSDEFRNYRGRGTSGMFELDDDVQTRAGLPTGVADLVAAGLTSAKYSVDLTPPLAPTPLMDNVTQITVSGNAIEYVSWAKIAGGAAKVAEKAPKPSAEWAPTVTADTLDTWAVYTQLTRQLIEDFAAVRSLIDGELRRDVARAEEADAVAVLAAASGTIPDVASTESLLAGIREGMGTVQEAGYTPTAVLLNPSDWAALDVAVMGDTLGGPRVNQTFWGLTPIPSSAQTAGTAVVGDFRSAIHHYTRSAIALYITDSHADTFLSNVFTLLAERRGLTAVVRPQALVEATGPVVGP
jgi:HK97 family phage major capsid protein